MNTLLIALAVVLACVALREWFTDTPSKDGTAKKVVNRLLVIAVAIYLAVAFGRSWFGHSGNPGSYANLAQSIAFICSIIAAIALSVTLVRRAQWWLNNRHHSA